MNDFALFGRNSGNFLVEEDERLRTTQCLEISMELLVETEVRKEGIFLFLITKERNCSYARPRFT